MAISTSDFGFVYRSLLGCGFLLLAPLADARAQREAELFLSGGVSLAGPASKRHNLPAAFRAVGGFNTGAALRLTVPVSRRLGVGLEQRITGLNQVVRYSNPYVGYSEPFGHRNVRQSGLSVRLYDVWTPGPRWGLDVALTGSYAWLNHSHYTYEGPLWYSYPAITTPARNAPLVLGRQIEYLGTVMLGAEALLRYEWGLRHSLLLTAAYQRGLRRLSYFRSTRLEYLDDAGAVQQGRWEVSSRASYATLQLGYGLRLGRSEAATRRHPTPRYSLDPNDPDDASEEPPTE